MTMMWKLGDVTIRKVAELEGALPGGGEGTMIPNATPEEVRKMPWLTPDFATEEGFIRVAVQALLVETPTRRIVVDTCVGNDKQRSGNPLFNNLKTGFLDTFEAASGWKRTDVDGVICTHLHVDHVGWNTMLVDGEWRPTFPNAAYYIARPEWEHGPTSVDGDDGIRIFADSVQPIVDAGLAQFVEPDERIGDEITLHPTPGHTPGHMSVRIRSGGVAATITGDMIHHACQIGRPDWYSGFDDDREAATATRQAFLASVADKGEIVFGTHFGGPTAGLVVSDGDRYRFVARHPDAT
jgi:glyoxylase-like metal-dependent hydrolase (beta-lactamase superfamily II)